MSRAAVRLGYTQSAVSQQLQALERIVGVRLVTRSPGARAVELTEAGTQLLAHADAIAGHLESARADLAAFSDGRTGELRLGAVPSAAAALVPALAAELRIRAPRLTLSVNESYFPAELLDGLGAGDLALVIAPEDEPREGLTSEAIMSDPYVLLVPAGDPLTHLARKLTPADLAGRDLIGKDCGTASQRALSSALSDYGLGTPPHPRPRSARGGGAGAAWPRRRCRPRAVTGRARPHDRQAPGRPLHPRPRDRPHDTRERRAHARGGARCRDHPRARRRQMFSGCHACQRSTSIHALKRRRSRIGYGSPM